MGQCYHIICDECRVTLWVGQDMATRPRESFYLYGAGRAFPREGETHHPLAEFLITHEAHNLRLLDTDAMCELDDYTRLADRPGLPVDDN